MRNVVLLRCCTMIDAFTHVGAEPLNKIRGAATNVFLGDKNWGPRGDDCPGLRARCERKMFAAVRGAGQHAFGALQLRDEDLA